MTRFTLLPLLGFLVACSEGPELMAPEAPVTEPMNQELSVGDAIQDALDRIVPSIEDRSVAGDLRVALLSATSDPGAVERVLVRLEATPAFAPDAEAIRLALGAGR